MQMAFQERDTTDPAGEPAGVIQRDHRTPGNNTGSLAPTSR
jgi:hypothetical protein